MFFPILAESSQSLDVYNLVFASEYQNKGIPVEASFTVDADYITLCSPEAAYLNEATLTADAYNEAIAYSDYVVTEADTVCDEQQDLNLSETFRINSDLTDIR